MGYTPHGQGIRSIRSDRELDDFIIQVQDWEDRLPWHGILRQNLDAIRKFLWNDAIWQAQLLQGADHAQGLHAPDFSFFNLVVIRNTGTWQGHDNLDTSFDIWGTADNLTGHFITRIHLTEMEVGIWHIFTGEDMAYHKIGQALSWGGYSLHFDTCR